MTDLQELRIKCARKMGWKRKLLPCEDEVGNIFKEVYWIHPEKKGDWIPDYPNSMDACMELLEQYPDYDWELQYDAKTKEYCMILLPPPRDITKALLGEGKTPNEAVMRAYLEVK